MLLQIRYTYVRDYTIQYNPEHPTVDIDAENDAVMMPFHDA